MRPRVKNILKKLKFHIAYEYVKVIPLVIRQIRVLILRTGQRLRSYFLSCLRQLMFILYRKPLKLGGTIKAKCRQKIANLKHKLSRLKEESVFTSTLQKIMPILEMGDPQKAVSYLQKKRKFLIFPSIRFLKSLYQYASLVEKYDVKLWDTKKTGEKIIIHFCCWGEGYAEKIKNYLIPSLLSENNLPLLAEKYNISLLIHCDRLTKKAVMKSGLYETLIKYTAIKFCVFPARLMKLYHACTKRSHIIFPPVRYLLLGVCQSHAFKVTLDNRACVSFLMPDFVLSESFMSYAFEKVANKKVILTTTYRSNYNAASSDLKKYYIANEVGRKLTISATKLVELQIKHIHHREYDRMVSTKNTNFTPMARLIFKNQKGFIFRCFHYHPVLINCKDISYPIKLDYLPIDNTALNCVLDSNIPYPEQAWVCDDACQMAVMELSGENPETRSIVNTRTLSYHELVDQLRDLLAREPKLYDSPFNRFLASYRHRFIVEESAEINSADDVIDDAAFFTQMYEALNQSKS